MDIEKYRKYLIGTFNDTQCNKKEKETTCAIRQLTAFLVIKELFLLDNGFYKKLKKRANNEIHTEKE